MGKGTGIQWCDDTCNCTTGCDGCELWKILESRTGMPHVMGGPCYAGNLQEVRLSKSLPHLYSSDFTEVRLAPGRMVKAAAWSDLTGTDRPGKPWLNNMPRLIFVDDLADLFSLAVPFDYIKTEVIDVATSKKGKRHVWMLLTKRPARAVEFAEWLRESHSIEWPTNIWIGTSVTSEKTANRAEILAYHSAPTKFLSVEPMWEYVDFAVNLIRNFAMVIYGGESAQRGYDPHPCDLQWIRNGIAKCRAAETSCFVKQLGSRAYDSTNPVSIGGYAIELNLRDSHGGDWDEWPSDLRIREMPRGFAWTEPVSVASDLPGQARLF